MLPGLGPLGGADCCGGLVVASGVRCTVLPLLLLHGCSAAVKDGAIVGPGGQWPPQIFF